MNHIFLMGRLTADPVQRTTKAGKACTTFTLAVDRRGEGADFIPCTAWERQAETAGKLLRRGTKITVEGTLRQTTYEKNPGEKTTRFDVWVDRFEFCEKKAAEPAPEMTPTDDDMPF